MDSTNKNPIFSIKNFRSFGEDGADFEFAPITVLTEQGYTNVTEVESRASSLVLPRCSNVTERKHYYAGTDLCASQEQSQTCLSYAEMQQSVQSNHLGSASWKKERFGKPFASERAEEARSGILHITTTYVQYIQYLLYGEPYDNQPPTGYRSVIRSPGRWVAFVGRDYSRGSSGASEGES